MDTLDIYFASLVAMTLHPGYLKEGAVKPSLDDCLKISVEALKLKEDLLCQLQQQE